MASNQKYDKKYPIFGLKPFLEDHAESRENEKRPVTDKEMHDNYFRIIEEEKVIVAGKSSCNLSQIIFYFHTNISRQSLGCTCL